MQKYIERQIFRYAYQFQGAVIYMTEISLIVTLNNQFTSHRTSSNDMQCRN